MAVSLSKHHLWQWFLLHYKEYLELPKKSKKELKYWTNELNAHLRAYFKFLHYSIYVDSEGTTGILTISVCGRAEYFGYVDKMVALAPAIPGWNIQALEAPRAMAYFREALAKDTGIDPHEFWCTVPHGGRAGGIAVYHNLYTAAKEDDFAATAEIALYNVLGERSFALDIGKVTVANLSRAPQDAALIRLEELPAYLPRGRKYLVVDAKGNIREQ